MSLAIGTSFTCCPRSLEGGAGSRSIFAYIPARGASKRVPRKNIRPLAGKPIIGHVIETLLQLDFLSAVHVSTDDPEIAEVAERFGASCLAMRDPALSGDGPGFSDLMREDIPRYVEAHDGDREVLFALATAALVPPTIYREAHALYRREWPDILMACEHYPSPPQWALVRKDDGYLTPLFPEMVRVNSQDLPEAMTDAGLFYLFSQDVMARYDSHKDVERLLPFLVPERYCVDVDRPEDWDLLEMKFALKTKGEA